MKLTPTETTGRPLPGTDFHRFAAYSKAMGHEPVTSQNFSPRGMVFSAVGMLIYAGLLWWVSQSFQARNASALPAVAGPVPPSARVRVVALNADGGRRLDESAIAAIVRLAPDFVLLRDVPETDASSLAKALGMQEGFSQPTADKPDTVNRAPRFCGAIGRKPMGSGLMGNNGNWQEFSIGASRVELSVVGYGSGPIDSAWHEAGSPPSIVADWPLAHGYITAQNSLDPRAGWFDALSPWLPLSDTERSSGDLPRILLSPGWSCTGGGALRQGNLLVTWIDASSSASASMPSKMPAPLGQDDD